MAAAIILIPEMLSGPEREAGDSGTNGETAVPRGESSLKTYTIDLSEPSGARAAQTIDTRVPPPEQKPAAPASVESPAPKIAPGAQANPEPAQRAAAPTATPPATTPAEQAPQPSVVGRPSAATADSRPPPRPLAPAADVPTSGAWAVQLGSFSRPATAERLVKELRAQGHNAFVMPVQSDTATLYRVRIGPMKDRSSAEAVLRDVEATAPGAAVVAHR